MKIARQPRILASTRLNGKSPPGSLSEGAAERSEAEGVSFDGCSGPTVCPPAHMNSEIFERLRSSGYTPSVSFADSSLREGAGVGCVPFNVPPGKRKVAGDFHRPYETQKWGHCTIQRSTLPQSASLTAPSEREPGCGLYHSTCRPENGRLRAIFIAPTEGVYHSTCRPDTGRLRAIFIAPTKGFCHSSGARKNLPVSNAKTIPGGAGHLPYGYRPNA